jgi:hypothetical protein
MEMDEDILQAVFDTPLQTQEFIDALGRMEKAAMDPKAQKQLEGALKLIESSSDVPEVAKIVDLIKKALSGYGYPAPSGTGKSADANKIEKKDLKKEDTKDSKDADKGKDKLVKNGDPALDAKLEEFYKEHEAQGKMLKEANKQIEELKKVEKMRGYMTKASEFDALPQDGLPEMLMEVGETNPDSLAKFEAILTSANEANKQSKIMQEIGTSELPKGILGEVDAGVKELMKKSGDLTEAAARVQFIKAHPEKYDELERDRMRTARGS